MATGTVRRAKVIAFRLRAQHLDRRLAAACFQSAATHGLQDGAPRSAVLALYARANGVKPDAWADEAFVQVWGPRGAVYVVPASDVAVFTLGLLPRDGRKQRTAQEAADAIQDAVGHSQVRKRDVLLAVGNRGDHLILACATGRIRIRWDGRDTLVSATDAPRTDPEEARAELLRRFLSAQGPSTAEGFAMWAGLSVTEARTTWKSLAEGFTEVTVEGGTRALLDTGTWRRSGHKVGVTPWTAVDDATRESIEREAAGFPLGLNREVTVSWHRG